ncbi:hypothetical protein V5O48_010368 [Marasmius crinis-equi]|uniref:Uncharacterized protein n=1 Tax=Marasmius crinis-equi TaxID=585013 RepID=A0ABR3F956_9AGAR
MGDRDHTTQRRPDPIRPIDVTPATHLWSENSHTVGYGCEKRRAGDLSESVAVFPGVVEVVTESVGEAIVASRISSIHDVRLSTVLALQSGLTPRYSGALMMVAKTRVIPAAAQAFPVDQRPPSGVEEGLRMYLHKSLYPSALCLGSRRREVQDGRA